MRDKKGSSKHIAMWSCPRSRSTVVARAFEQLDDCFVYDEPFYPAYLLEKERQRQHREDILNNREASYSKVIEIITGELPQNINFSFQKHHAKNLLPKFGREWLRCLDNFILIRHPKEVILSYSKISENVTEDGIGLTALYQVYEEIKLQTGQTPLIINSDDIIRDPEESLSNLCKKLNISYSKKMLAWKEDLEGSNLLLSGNLLPYAKEWYSGIMGSNSFKPYEGSATALPSHLEPLLQASLPIYNELLEKTTSLLNP